MANDAGPTQNPEVQAYATPRKAFRRKRKYQGATWTPPSADSGASDGLYCRHCHKHHGYMTMGLNFEQNQKKQWKMIWYCRKTGFVLGEDLLGERK